MIWPPIMRAGARHHKPRWSSRPFRRSRRRPSGAYFRHIARRIGGSRPRRRVAPERVFQASGRVPVDIRLILFMALAPALRASRSAAGRAPSNRGVIRSQAPMRGASDLAVRPGPVAQLRYGAERRQGAAGTSTGAQQGLIADGLKEGKMARRQLRVISR